MATVVEQHLAARHPDCPGADRIIVGRRLIGVVDGATAKPWDAEGTVTGEQVADVVAGVLRDADGEDLPELLDAMATRLPSTVEGSAATFAVLDPIRRQVWRVGEQWIVVDGDVHSPLPGPEQVVAAARQMVLRAHLVAGASVSDLLADDPGREAVLPLLRMSDRLRNTWPNGFAAVDGTQVPVPLQERLHLLPTAREVVLASDGYPSPATNLADAESALRARLAADPLMVQDPPATKGRPPGASSYDDRAFVRVRL